MKLPIINRFTCTKAQLNSFINNFNSKGIFSIIGYINENPKDFRKNFKENKNIVSSLNNNIIAIKLSSLNINDDYNGALEMSKEICETAIKNNNRIVVDAEYNSIQENITRITDILLKTFNKKDINVYKTYQMYRNDQYEIYRNDLLEDKNYRIGFKIVRGAYFNEERNNIWMNKTHQQTDNNYNNAIKLFNGNNRFNKLICATHNEFSIEYAMSFNNPNIHYAQLMGMSDKLTDRIKPNNTVYKYIPYGPVTDTFPYLVRRLYENLDFSKYLFR